MPQNLSWNNEVLHLSNSKAFVKRIVATLPEVPYYQEEAYRLHISSDSLILEATTEKGIFHGWQTIRQLTQIKGKDHFVTGCSIVDWPAFAMRGFMQDVGRNFQSMDMLKEQIDVLAAYKLNVFHFHVTENPGWRLESKIYPQITDSSSMSRHRGDYYTQDDFLELLDYCQKRFITLIPEFDVPGHCEAFRKAFLIDSMSDPRVQPILLELIDELCSLAPADKMPFIHLGTDEVWHDFERPAPGLLDSLMERIRQNGREVIVWRPGQQVDGDSSSVTQLWSSRGEPKPGHPYLDSRLNYLNHLDPFSGVQQLYFDRICGASHGDSLRLGGILCCWNDNNVHDEYDILRHNPVYPGILTYSEISWTGQKKDIGDKYLARFPERGDELFTAFCDFEDRLIAHREKYFAGKPFPYVKQTNIEWKVIGPIAHYGDVDAQFAVEDDFLETYLIDSTAYSWQGPFIGGTIHLSHFFGYPSYFLREVGTYYAFTRLWSPKVQTIDVWIGFHDWSRSGGRRGGPFPQRGEWHNTHPKVWVNGELIAAPEWNNPGLARNTEEIPFSDENYFFREPSSIHLQKGWNEVLLKIPVNKNTWKRMFTFVPLQEEKGIVKEIKGLKFSTDINEMIQ